MSYFTKPFTSFDEAYKFTVARVLHEGEDRGDRTGVGTRSIFNHNIELDLSAGTMPILSLKKTGYRDAVAELIWMLSGSNSLAPLLRQGIHIWTDWPMKAYIIATGENITRDEFEARILGDRAFAAQWGTIDPSYGIEMRSFQSRDGMHIDQMQNLIDELKRNPESRRLVWSLWRPEYVTIKGGTGLPPCHCAGALSVRNGVLSLKVRLRSNDIGLGNPYNASQYGYLLHLLANLTGYEVGRLIIDIDDCHIYTNHLDPLAQILDRETRPDPKFVWKRRPQNLDDNLSVDDFEILDYNPQPFIKLPVAV